MIEVRCIHDLAQAEPWREAINALNLASPRPDPFSTFEFYANHLRNATRFEAGRSQLWLLLAFDGTELAGYMALKRSTQRVLGLRAARLDLLTESADRPHLVARADRVAAVNEAIFAYLMSRKKEWSLLEFQQQEAGLQLVPSSALAASNACRVTQWPNLANATIPLHWSSLASYFGALSKKSRSNVSRQMRTLLAAGEVQLLTSCNPQAVQALFELYRGIEPHSWKARSEGAAIGGDLQSLDYFMGLLAPNQPMRIWIQILVLDGLPVAGLITGAFDKGLHALHIVYDERVANLGPGSAIMLLGVRLALELRCSFLNLLRGFSYYKTRWLAQMSETLSVQVYRTGTPFYWRRALGDLRRRWVRAPATIGSIQFNPARREAAADGAEPSAGAPAVQLMSVAQRAHVAGLIAQARQAGSECLSGDALAAVMPFATQRAGRGSAGEKTGSRGKAQAPQATPPLEWRNKPPAGVLRSVST